MFTSFSEVLFKDSAVLRNSACAGGAFFSFWDSVVVFTNAVFSDNAALMGGAAVIEASVHLMDSINSNFFNNTAGSCGGLLLQDTVYELDNNEFTGNRARNGNGGGLCAVNAVGTVSGTFRENHADLGGGGGFYWSNVKRTASPPTLAPPLVNFTHNTARYGPNVATMGLRLLSPADRVTGVPGGLLGPGIVLQMVDFFNQTVVSANGTTLLATRTLSAVPFYAPFVSGFADYSSLRIRERPGLYHVSFQELEGMALSASLSVVLGECPPGSILGRSLECQPCAAGSARNRSMGDCKPCNQGFAQQKEGQQACDACTTGRYSSALGSTACAECPASYAAVGTAATSCKYCPLIECQAGTISNQRGYWVLPSSRTDSSASLSVFPCPRDLCRDDGTCSSNRMPADSNPLCGACLFGYQEVFGQCVGKVFAVSRASLSAAVCSQAQPGLIVASAIIVLALAVLLHVMSRRSNDESSLSGLLSSLLYLFAAFQFSYNGFSPYLDWTGFLSQGSLGFVLPGCLAPMSPVSNRIVQLLSPYAVLIAFLFVAAVHRMFSHHDFSAYVRTAALWLVSSYTGVVQMVFASLQCVHITSATQVLAETPSVSCGGDEFPVLVAVAGIAGILHGVGLPLLLGFALWKHRSKSLTHTHPLMRLLRSFGLQQQYADNRVWYILVDFARRSALVVLGFVWSQVRNLVTLCCVSRSLHIDRTFFFGPNPLQFFTDSSS